MVFGKTGTKIIDNVTVATSGIQNSTLIDLNSATDFAIGYTLTFAAGATGNVQILLFADPTGINSSFSAPGTYDNYTDMLIIPVSAGNTVSGITSFQKSGRYVIAQLVNLDAVKTITAASVWSIIQSP